MAQSELTAPNAGRIVDNTHGATKGTFGRYVQIPGSGCTISELYIDDVLIVLAAKGIDIALDGGQVVYLAKQGSMITSVTLSAGQLWIPYATKNQVG